MATILITTSTFAVEGEESLRLLEKAGYHAVQNPHKRTLTESEVEALIARCQPVALIAGLEPLTERVMKVHAGLKVISRCGVGLDNVDLSASQRLGIRVFTTPNAPTQPVAELTLGFMFGLIRHIPFSDHKIRDGEWKKTMGYLFEELVVGIIGVGRIGKKVAAMCRALGAKVIASDVKPDRDWASQQSVELLDRDDLIRQADILSLHLPYATDDLYHLIGPRQLSMMKRGSYLINTSRGGLVDEQALCESIQNGHLAGAAIDTFEKEPYDGPLRRLDRVILSPHAGSYARAARMRMEREATENAIAGLHA